MAVTPEVIPENTIRVLDHGFVRLDDAMASDLSVVNGARVSFARHKTEMDEGDAGLIRFLMRERHGTPFEHNALRFHVRCPIFVAREWFRHRWGCLTGENVITFVNGKGVTGPDHRKTVDELWRMWVQGERNGHAMTEEQAAEVRRLDAVGMSTRAIARTRGVGRRGARSVLRGTNALRDGRWRVRKMRLRVLNEMTGEFASGHIADIVDTGVQPVYRLSLADGKQLTVTENHRLLTSEGWKTMREAVGLVGDGEKALASRECLLMTNGIPVYQDYDWRFASSVGFVRDMPVRRKGWKLTAQPARVIAVEYVGVRQTYDLAVDGPWHNFVANGIVVHNSFNEFSMRYAKATDEFYVPDADDVRTQVGKPGAYSFEPVDPEVAEQTRDELQAVYESAFAAYERLVELGVARELARAALPVGAYTEFYWTVNARALMNFLSLRAAEAAQREIRLYAEACERFFAERMPVTHEAFVASGRVAP